MPEHIWFNQEQVLTEIQAALAIRTAPFQPKADVPARLPRPVRAG
jgi:hypothetical protein